MPCIPITNPLCSYSPLFAPLINNESLCDFNSWGLNAVERLPFWYTVCRPFSLLDSWKCFDERHLVCYLERRLKRIFSLPRVYVTDVIYFWDLILTWNSWNEMNFRIRSSHHGKRYFCEKYGKYYPYFSIQQRWNMGKFLLILIQCE